MEPIITRQLDVLPVRTGGAAENMATDFLLLQRYPESSNARFRHYEWRGPAFTFGYSQKIEAVRAGLPTQEQTDLCRRPTGGGVVDHRDDWTYALVIPRGHPLEEMRAGSSYRLIHLAIQQAFEAQGIAARLQQSPDPNSSGGNPANACFERAELYDVVHAVTGAKLAGAAQKRNKQGLLFQGSIWKPAAGAPVDWEVFHDTLIAELAKLLELTPVPTPWPDLNEEELSMLTERYATPEWMEFR